MFKYISFLSFTAFLLSCSSSRFVEPLAKKENALSIDLGGPLVNVPGVATMPLPFSSLTYGRGLTNNTTVYTSWHTTAAVFGVAQFDFGLVHEVWRNSRRNMGITFNPSINFATDVFEKNNKLWPVVEANYYWKYKMKGVTQADLLTNKSVRYNYFYGGLGTWFELNGTKAHGEDQKERVLPMVQIGHVFRRGKWSFSTEVKFITPNISNENIVLDYKSISGNSGATGIYLGLVKRF